ncbi:MAG TPA: isoprenylcysteine carboxylmethyltransferase family protein [Desulfobacterales bacterium]|nr:isoprenylcysteine carboxylmethyltransferase family protein [Desulfobacterales bacterium]
MRQFVTKTASFLLKFSVLFILVEVIWMLLPFAGFLYGSVLHLKYLNRNPDTAWLTHFVFPVHTMFPLGIILMSAGLILFLFGAAQIYMAKFRKTGLVTSGLYRKIRHPQYIALVSFGVGTLLTWGRFVTFIAFFIMMFLYYRLAHSEEKNCERLFGEAYEEYKTRTYFLFPGEGWLGAVWKRLPGQRWPRWIAVPVHFALIVGLALVLGFFIQSIKVRYQKVPFITAEIESLPERAKNRLIPYLESEGSRLILVQGPLGQAQKESYAASLLEMIANSPTLQTRLDFLKDSGEDRAVVLIAPAGRRPKTVPAENSKVELFIVRVQPTEPGVDTPDLLTNPGKSKFVSAFVATLDPTTKPQGRDPVIDCKDHPYIGIFPRWANMMGRVKERITGLGGDDKKGPRKLILVQAPLVRARDKGFAQQIMDRLLRSETVQGMLAKYQIGGDVLAVAFPRPGPNWYKEHHGVPQIGAFIILVRKKKPLSDGQLFRRDTKNARQLEAAFIVEMDFAIPYPEDPVYQNPFVVGPLRDLEERWEFFLSGLK